MPAHQEMALRHITTALASKPKQRWHQGGNKPARMGPAGDGSPRRRTF